MWNFAGRQNDIQGHGEITNGNWITGINAIDSIRLGDQAKLPQEFKNKGRNAYYMLPLILGIIGIIFMYNRGVEGRRDLWTVSLLFIMTGLAIVIYLNQSPLQPRERDYCLCWFILCLYKSGSESGYWALYEGLKKYIPETVSASVAGGLALLLVPVIMAAENWGRPRVARTDTRHETLGPIT